METRYIASDGTLTTLRVRAAKFKTTAETKAFATHHNMLLDGPLSICEEHFVDFELRG